MKTNPYMPIAAVAAAIALGGASAQGTSPEDASLQDPQDETQLSYSTTGSEEALPTNKQASVNPQRMAASEVFGMSIDNVHNEKIGEIDDIFVDSNTGKMLAIVVSTTGFLGMGQNQTLISPQDLRLNAEHTFMLAGLTKEQIRSAPNYLQGETGGLEQVRSLGKSLPAGGKRTERADGEGPQLGPELGIAALRGRIVENHHKEAVGNVDEVLLNLETMEVVGVLVSTRGFFGIGDRKTLFGLQELFFDPTNAALLVDYESDQIGAFPEYKENDEAPFDGLRDRNGRTTVKQTSSDKYP